MDTSITQRLPFRNYLAAILAESQSQEVGGPWTVTIGRARTMIPMFFLMMMHGKPCEKTR